MAKVLGLIAALVFLLYACTQAGSREEEKKAAADPHAGLRGACRQFIEARELETRNAEWGEYWDWTVVSNSDGTFSVGARYAVGTRTRYSTCVLSKAGKFIHLEKLTRIS